MRKTPGNITIKTDKKNKLNVSKDLGEINMHATVGDGRPSLRRLAPSCPCPYLSMREHVEQNLRG